MYELNSRKNKSIYILFAIMLLVSMFTIIAYTLILDKRTYQYTPTIIAKQINIEDNQIEETLAKVTESTVGISKIENIGETIFLENSIENLNLGSGIIVSEEGYILTNWHVAGDKYSICYITLKNGLTDTGTVIWANEELDLAIIKSNIKQLPKLTLGNSENINVGNKVYAIGNPLGYELQQTVTTGIISGMNRTIQIEEKGEKSYLEGLIQTDATINEGNSGGALINTKGEVIGITTLKIEENEGIGFAIPINIIKPIIEKLEKTGSFEEPYLGIYGYDKEAKAYLSKQINIENGIYIEKINNQGPLKNQNIQQGDILKSIDNQEISTINQLKEYIYQKNVGDEVNLVLKRSKTDIKIQVKLGKRN